MEKQRRCFMKPVEEQKHWYFQWSSDLSLNRFCTDRFLIVSASEGDFLK